MEGSLTGPGRHIHVFSDITKIPFFLTDLWREISCQAVAKKGVFDVALSGGNTPAGFYSELSVHVDGMPWEATRIFLVDERFVPVGHKDSNAGMIREVLIGKVRGLGARFYGVPLENMTLEDSAEAYESGIVGAFGLSEGDLPRFDLILLGMGEDGHTASIFPGDVTRPGNGKIVIKVDHKGTGHDRISLSEDVLNSADNVVFLVTGENKAEMIARVIDGAREDVPAARIRPVSGKVTFVLDGGAAGRLKGYGKGL